MDFSHFVQYLLHLKRTLTSVSMRWMDKVQKGAYDGKINECLKINLSVSVKWSRVQKDTFSSGESMICYASSKIDKKKTKHSKY